MGSIGANTNFRQLLLNEAVKASTSKSTTDIINTAVSEARRIVRRGDDEATFILSRKTLGLSQMKAIQEYIVRQEQKATKEGTKKVLSMLQRGLDSEYAEYRRRREVGI